MASVSDVVTYYGVNVQTVRNWGARFSSYLSPGANPPRGQVREYTDDDLRVLDQIATMRRSNLSYSKIEAALSAGERGNIQNLGQPPPQKVQPNGGNTQIETIDRLQQFMEKAIAPYQDHISRLETEVKDVRNDHIEAEKRGFKLEVEVEHLQGDRNQLEGQLEVLEAKLDVLVNRRWYTRMFRSNRG